MFANINLMLMCSIGGVRSIRVPVSDKYVEPASTRNIGSVRSVKLKEDEDTRWQRKKAGG